MRVLYVGMKYDYGKPEHGCSYEHYNFCNSLLNMGNDILYFDFMALMQNRGKDWMNRRLLEAAKSEKADLMFVILQKRQLNAKVLRKISRNIDTVTLNWFCDDHWRFDKFSRHWAPCFNWVVTTARSAVSKYADIGYRNVIKSQWACNHFLYRKLDLPLRHDVTFVGMPHGDRREVIEALRSAGIDVRVWGTGWEEGRIAQEDMIKVFNQSRINLNLSNASVATDNRRLRPRSAKGKWAGRVLDRLPLGRKRGNVDEQAAGDCQSYFEQIKGRNFEVPGCGAFLLTGHADNLEDYYADGAQIVCFDDTDDLIEKVRYYLSHEEERAAIAQAGYQRTLKEHTYAHRFTEVFRELELPCPDLSDIMEGRVEPGETVELS